MEKNISKKHASIFEHDAIMLLIFCVQQHCYLIISTKNKTLLLVELKLTC